MLQTYFSTAGFSLGICRVLDFCPGVTGFYIPGRDDGFGWVQGDALAPNKHKTRQTENRNIDRQIDTKLSSLTVSQGTIVQPVQF